MSENILSENLKTLSKEKNHLVTIELTVFDAHKLLEIIEQQMRICNRDTTNAVDIFEKISTQLSGKEHIIYGSEKHKRLDPELFKKLEEEKKKDSELTLKAVNKEVEKRTPWWKKLFGST